MKKLLLILALFLMGCQERQNGNVPILLINGNNKIGGDYVIIANKPNHGDIIDIIDHKKTTIYLLELLDNGVRKIQYDNKEGYYVAMLSELVSKLTICYPLNEEDMIYEITEAESNSKTNCVFVIKNQKGDPECDTKTVIACFSR